MREVTELAGMDAVRELLAMDSLRFALSYQEIAEEICLYIGWEPVLSAPHWTACALDKLGKQIADLVCLSYPKDRSTANPFFSVLCSEEAQKLLAVNDKDDTEPIIQEIQERELDW